MTPPFLSCDYISERIALANREKRNPQVGGKANFPSVCMAEGHPSVKRTALRHIDEVVHMIVAALIEDGEPIPEDVSVSQEPLVSVTV